MDLAQSGATNNRSTDGGRFMRYEGDSLDPRNVARWLDVTRRYFGVDWTSRKNEPEKRPLPTRLGGDTGSFETRRDPQDTQLTN
jgi:hypothetical protein